MDAMEHLGGATACSSRSDGAACSSRSDGTAQAFLSLKRLVLRGMQNLERWWEAEGEQADPPVFPRLDELEISSCLKLTTMPQLPSLKSLHLEQCNPVLLGSAVSLSSVTSLKIDNFTYQPRPSSRTQAPLVLPQGKGIFGHMRSLESMEISGDEELARLLEDEETRGWTASLSELKFFKCNWLFPSSPLGLWNSLSSLRRMEISNCDAQVSWPEEEFRCLISLEQLSISQCSKLSGASPSRLSPSTTLSMGGAPPNMKTLKLSFCDDLVELPRCPSSLQHLYISCCKNLKTLPDWLGCLSQLRVLHTWGCESITSLPQSAGGLTALHDLRVQDARNLVSLPDGMENLTALRCLSITKCPRLKSLPESLQQRLPHLITLWIEDCPDLEGRCKDGGEYWHLIANIPNRHILLNTRSKRIINTLLPCSRYCSS